MWSLGGRELTSRFLLGTAKYPSLQIMQEAIKIAKVDVLTVSLRREQANKNNEDNENNGEVFWDIIKALNVHVLPNTAGCRSAQEAVTTAQMARELFNTNWIKLEVIGDDYNLQPDPFELLQATKILVKEGFTVFAYCTEDLVLCQRLVDAGCSILMPWGSPIGSGKGILNPYAFEILRARLPDVTLILDAGIGKPSHAVQAMEMGFDGVLLNTAVSLARCPVQMASAFRDAVIAGRDAYEAGLMLERNCAHPSTPLLDTPFWHVEKEK